MTASAVHRERIVAGREVFVDHVIRIRGRDAIDSERASWPRESSSESWSGDPLSVNDRDQVLARRGSIAMLAMASPRIVRSPPEMANGPELPGDGSPIAISGVPA